jgi:flagellar biosynthetic protein FliS
MNMQENTPNHEKAATAYQSTYVNNMNGFEIVSELYKGIIKNIHQAKTAHQNGNLEDMCALNQKTFKILVALQSHLDFQQGGEAAIFLNRLYNHVFASLTKILRQDNPQQEFDRLLEILQPISKQWAKLSSPDVQDAPMDDSKGAFI